MNQELLVIFKFKIMQNGIGYLLLSLKFAKYFQYYSIKFIAFYCIKFLESHRIISNRKKIIPLI